MRIAALCGCGCGVKFFSRLAPGWEGVGYAFCFVSSGLRPPPLPTQNAYPPPSGEAWSTCLRRNLILVVAVTMRSGGGVAGVAAEVKEEAAGRGTRSSDARHTSTAGSAETPHLQAAAR